MHPSWTIEEHKLNGTDEKLRFLMYSQTPERKKLLWALEFFESPAVRALTTEVVEFPGCLGLHTIVFVCIWSSPRLGDLAKT